MMGYEYSMMKNWYGYEYNMMGGWFGMMLIPIIIIGLVIYVVYSHSQNNNVTGIGSIGNSLNILNDRFARGEINKEEYNRKKDLILNHKRL